MVTVKGKLVNCSGSPVTNGFATIYYGNIIRYVSTDDISGEFASTFYSCAGMPSTCEIYGTDITTQQQGATVNVTIVSPTTDAGNITACGTSSLQYINYNIDGVNYSVSSLVPGDNMSGIYVDSLTTQGVHINSYHSNTSAISFAFENSSGNGGAVSYLSTQQNAYITALLPPFTAVITNNAQTVGQFYEGSFTGQFKDNSGVTSDISCSFRVRRQN